MITIPIELKNAIHNNQLIVFVGAGLSYNLTNINKQPLKGWGNLVGEVLENLKEKNHDVDALIPLVDKYDPIKILDLIESDNDLPKKEIYNFIKDFLDLSEDNNLQLHQKLFKLSKKIITTNYDCAFEKAIPQLRKNKAYRGKNYELTTHKDPNAVLLFKLHGCFEDADSMVLFPSNYKHLYENSAKDAEHSLLVLKNIIYNNAILFIGTGMGDFQINNIFKAIKELQGEYNQQHFIISNKTLDSSLNFLTALTIKNYSEIDAIVDELLKIKKDADSNASDEIKALKKQLEEANKKITELSSKSNILNKDHLLEREALKYFTKGLDYSLSEEFEKSIQEYEVAIELKPDFHEAFYNWGNALSNLVKIKEEKSAEELYLQAFEKYEKAIDIKPDLHEAFNNWAANLGNLAKTKEGKAAEDLYKQGFQKFEKAIYIKPDKHEAFNNWGIQLANLAKTKEGKAAEELYLQAFEKYEKAIDIKPDYRRAFNNWGTDLGNLAKTKKGKAAEDLYKQAIEKFKKAIKFGGEQYNLACLHAVQNNKKEALRLLKTSLSKNEITMDFVLKDEDWKPYLEDEDFKEVIELHRK